MTPLLYFIDLLFRQSVSDEYDWGQLVRCNHTVGRTGISGRLGLHSVGCLEGVSELVHMSLYATNSSDKDLEQGA